MSIIGSEQYAQTITAELTRTGVKVSGIAITASSKIFLRGLKLAEHGLQKLPGVPKKNPHGKLRLRTLQHISGGDLHSLPVSSNLMNSLSRDLKKRGINFSVEKGTDGTTYFHFAGKDIDSVRHAITQVAARVEKTAHTRDQTSPEKTDLDPATIETSWEDAPTQKQTQTVATPAKAVQGEAKKNTKVVKKEGEGTVTAQKVRENLQKRIEKKTVTIKTRTPKPARSLGPRR
ncbi:Protein of uncharacterised function (DUF3801) [Actinobaculum suis]|uniref:Protein of uncharacterized function (DUF3801) n=1 Tax=Actinobaculum suis TaxID=1657 RepID=A0A7Z8Y7U8_9ACTO|nr:PcfB family protein [Actinobaculum suis]VDG75787.1 Protein of uncharacterised function (DUF3801) [Actinobaculum suis]